MWCCKYSTIRYCTVLYCTESYVTLRPTPNIPSMDIFWTSCLALSLSRFQDGWEEHGVARGMDDVGTCTRTFATDEVWDVGSHVHRSIAITIISSSKSFLQDAKDLA
jgi:hypothetical protein